MVLSAASFLSAPDLNSARYLIKNQREKSNVHRWAQKMTNN
jgi:hypothetical protein